jgi:hypothetical protein
MSVNWQELPINAPLPSLARRLGSSDRESDRASDRERAREADEDDDDDDGDGGRAGVERERQESGAALAGIPTFLPYCKTRE